MHWFRWNIRRVVRQKREHGIHLCEFPYTFGERWFCSIGITGYSLQRGFTTAWFPAEAKHDTLASFANRGRNDFRFFISYAWPE